ncbi:MAG: hypothetical protein WAK75_10895 [Methanoregula sp.]|uniref:hypothetical protein n=2 Tax=Methanoregula sp. TaxID=2052170 RepID=UPI003BB1CBAA
MKNTTTHDTTMTDTKMQETAPQKSGSGTSAHPSTVVPKVISHFAKHVKALIRGSHKDEYRKDHPKAGAGVKTPSAPVLK